MDGQAVARLNAAADVNLNPFDTPATLGRTVICSRARMSPLYSSVCWIAPRCTGSAEMAVESD